ncbi:MAG TPA: UDP-N-acetylglucosamine 2-epimerase (non-hydrolyzing) [Puia sp.]|nr:UDP-N-acetylglucosamine 2-epimerase (non-hydrolyzing) [Puia sp.]
MRIAHIVGNRPQFVKLSLLHRAWQGMGGERPLIIHTGQHFSDDMSGIFFQEFGIPGPDHQLQINGLPHGEMIGRMLIELDRVLATERPEAVVVYGDTNTTLAGALAAKKRNIPLIHVESGIRTGKEDMPEESNRYVTDRLADLNFACTHLGVENLLREGMPPQRIIHSGDLMLDAALLFADRAREQSSLPASLVPANRPFVLATIHRAENTDDPEALGGILRALRSIHAEIPVVFPLHPRTRQVIDRAGLPLDVVFTPPLGYLDTLALVQAATYVITDSGGLCREAFFFEKPSLIVMQSPFWPEIFANGPSLATEADEPTIRENFRKLTARGRVFRKGVFGEGNAAEKISRTIINNLHE